MNPPKRKYCNSVCKKRHYWERNRPRYYCILCKGELEMFRDKYCTICSDRWGDLHGSSDYTKQVVKEVSEMLSESQIDYTQKLATLEKYMPSYRLLRLAYRKRILPLIDR